jgi:hypothetical protein
MRGCSRSRIIPARGAVRLAGARLLIPFLILLPGPAYAEWQAIERAYLSPDPQTVYVDQASIDSKGSLVMLSQLTDFKWMQGNAGFGRLGLGAHRFLSTKTQKQIDCVERRARLLAFREFCRRMGTGRSADGHVDTNAWLPVQPETIHQALWEIACAGRRARG